MDGGSTYVNNITFQSMLVTENIIFLIRRSDVTASGNCTPTVYRIHTTPCFKKTSTHIIGYTLRNSCPILIIFDIKIPHII